MKPHEYLFIQGEIDERYRLKPEERAQGKTAPYAFRIKKVMLLGNVAENYISGFTVDIDTSLLNATFRKNFVALLKENKGKIPLSVMVRDKATCYNLEFRSKKFSVAVTNDFIGRLRYMGLTYTVQKKPGL